MALVIEAKNISKRYRLGTYDRQTLKDEIVHKWRRILRGTHGSEFDDQRLQADDTGSFVAPAYGPLKEFWALKNISFKVERGEIIGIIGKNGAGKTTLLKILSRITKLTEGMAVIDGRVASMLEVGTGFHPDLTGRENIYLNGSILGMRKTEIDTKIKEIVDFSEIEQFIDTPVKRYSSGMYVRLAFAVVAHLNPEILIIDEVLSVGDISFRAKCYKRIRKLNETGVTVLFTSHDITLVRSLCQKVLWLERGEQLMWGDAKRATSEYEKYCWREQGVVMDKEDREESEADEIEKCLPIQPNGIGDSHIPDFLLHPNPEFEKLAKNTRYGTGTLKIKNMVFLDTEGEQRSTFEYNEEMKIHFLVEAQEKVNSDIILGLRIKNNMGDFLLSFHDIWGKHHLNMVAGEQAYFETAIRLPITHGKYCLLAGIFGFKNGQACVEGKYEYGRAILYDIIEDAFFFEVRLHKSIPLSGPVHLESKLVEHK